MHFVWFRSTSLRVFKFLQIKELAPNFWGGTNFSECLDYLVLLLYFNLKSSMEPNSSSFIKFQSILLEPERLFWESWNFCKLKRGDLISGRKQFCRMSELFALPFCISILKVFLHPNSLPLISCQCILDNSGVLPSGFSNLHKLKRRDLISGGDQFFRMSELFGPPFSI